MAITATRGKDTLAIATVKCSTLTRSCRNCNKWCWNTSTAVCYISWQLPKLTAVHLITSIRTWSNPVASFRGGDALITAAPKCSILTGSCANCNIQYVLKNEVDNCQNVQVTYCSWSHRFHQSMFQSQYIGKRKRHTDHLYIETGWNYNLVGISMRDKNIGKVKTCR